MYNENNNVLASMFVSQNDIGVLTANKILVGERDNEKISLFIDSDGKGCITSDKAFVDGIEISKNSNNRLLINVPVVSDFSLENNGVEVGSFYTSANGKSVLNTNFAYINTLVVNGYSYSPTTITVDGQQITVLAR